MDFRQPLSAELPPPRDGEPPSLRQDILDELADHLACAYRRELLRGVEATEAQAGVLEHFGDPAAVARGLWLDAMKERIMLQRVVIATCLVVMLICVGFTGYAWVQMNRARAIAQLERARAEVEAAMANRRAAEALAESQATKKVLLGQIGEISESLRHPRSPDWNPVRFKLRQERPDGPPVAAAEVRLIMTGGQPAMSRTSDAAGIADFGVVQPGDYRLNIDLGWNGNWRWGGTGRINVRPGSEVQKTVICPKTPPDRVPVTVQCQWPADVEAQNVILYAEFSHGFLQLEPDVHWGTMVVVPGDTERPGTAPRRSGRASAPKNWVGSIARAFLAGPGPERAWIKDARGPLVWAVCRFDSLREMEEIAARGRGVRADLRESDIDSGSDRKQMELGTYALSRLLALRLAPSGDVPSGRRRYEVLAACLRGGTGQPIEFLGGPPQRTLESTFLTERLPGETSASPVMASPKLPADYWKKAVFDARRGKPNEWTIPIPDGLIKAVRDRLAEDATSQSKSAPAKPKSKP